ncbi:MAG: nucleoside 2-deoxyribosyltransferase [bacterium]
MTTDPMADATPRANIYFAGPLFTHAECRWNREIALALETLGYVVSLPQRLVADLVTLGAPLPTEEIFDRLVRQIREVDVVVAVLDGPDPDSGTAFECGLAYAWGTPVIGVRTDLRRGGDHAARDVNLMLAHGCAAIVKVGPDDDPSAVTGLAERLSVAMDHLPRASGDEG